MSVDIEQRKKIDLKPGNTAKVWVKITEAGGKTRLQAFEGIIIAHKHGYEPGATFTVRKVSSGVGVERIFPLFSPIIDKIEITKKAKARRAKLYYIRDKAAKAIRKKMKSVRVEQIKQEISEQREKKEAPILPQKESGQNRESSISQTNQDDLGEIGKENKTTEQ